jgi:hypothetical protein
MVTLCLLTAPTRTPLNIDWKRLHEELTDYGYKGGVQVIRPVTQINMIYGYCRVSTKEQSKSGVSIETQQSLDQRVRSE